MKNKKNLQNTIACQQNVIRYMAQLLEEYLLLGYTPKEIRELIRIKEENRTISPAQQVISEDNSRFVCEKW